MPAKEKKKLSADGQSQTPPLRGTFTAEEVARLQSWLPKYMQTKRLPGKKLLGFWEPMFSDWWANYILPTLTTEEFAAGVDQGDRKGERVGIIQKVRKLAS